jgi:hypothetical protein
LNWKIKSNFKVVVLELEDEEEFNVTGLANKYHYQGSSAELRRHGLML